MKKVLQWIAFQLFILPLFSCTIVTSDTGKQEYVVTADSVQFNMKSCVKYESDIYNYDFYVIETEITNKKDEQTNVDYDIFSFNTSDVRLVHDNSLFFSGLDNVKYEKTELLIKSKKGKKLSDIKMEIDFGIFSLGKSFYLNELPNTNSNIKFEGYLLNKFGCIDEKYFNTFYEVIKCENLGLIQECKYSFNEVLDEDMFVFYCDEGTYSLHFNKNKEFDMMYIFQNSFYDVYINGKKNQKFVSSRKIYEEFNSNKWQNTIKNLVDMQYFDANCSNFSYGRVVNNEDQMFINFIVKGINAFGVNLIKEGILYLYYDFENDKFDILYLKIGEDIFVDNRKKYNN